MVTIIKKKIKKEKITELLMYTNNRGRLLDVSKYSGKLRIKENPLKIQKRLRNEHP